MKYIVHENEFLLLPKETLEKTRAIEVKDQPYPCFKSRRKLVARFIKRPSKQDRKLLLDIAISVDD